MSTSDEVVMQKTDANTTVTWSDYEHLRDHLTGVFEKSTEKLEGDVQAVQLQLGETETTVNAIQTKIDNLQTSVQNLQ